MYTTYYLVDEETNKIINVSDYYGLLDWYNKLAKEELVENKENDIQSLLEEDL